MPRPAERALDAARAERPRGPLPGKPAAGADGRRPVAPKAGRAEQLRGMLLRDPRNAELRQAYLALRTEQLARADLRMAVRRVAAARLVRGSAGFAGFGLAGGLLAGPFLEAVARPVHGAVGLGITLGVVCAAVGAAGFGGLGLLGHVVLGDLVGEEHWQERGKAGLGSALGALAGRLVEAAGGAVWGAACGLLIGVLAGVVGALLELPTDAWPTLPLAGAAGGALLGAALSALVGIRGPASPAVQDWGGLGPLPPLAYFRSRRGARRRYLS
jgi:hypothetical protein